MTIDWIQRAHRVNHDVRNFIDGRKGASGSEDSLEKFSPRDGRLLYQFESSSPRDVEAVVTSARRAHEDARWRGIPLQRRKGILHKLSSLIAEHAEELALLECLDVGKPISEARDADIPAAVEVMRFSAEAADKFYGKVYAADTSNLSYQLRRPVGVVAGIIGWNFPLVLAVDKLGPVLGAGNCFILKPSELTPSSATRLAELALLAGVPEGVFNVIHGGPDVGAALAQHPKVDLVTFTGSTQAGKKLLIASGQSNMKRLILECGGKAPNIVFDDCPDLDAVAESVVARAFWNQGQVCTASSRLLIQHGVKDELLHRVMKKTASLTPGDPLDVRSKFGAVVSRSHERKIKDYIESGLNDGARVVYRGEGGEPVKGGFYVPPVIFDDVSPSTRIAREEIFGPVVSVMPFTNEEEAIQIANDTIYGLSATLWTKDLGRAHRITQSIEAGWIVVNATGAPRGGPGANVMSIGGHKESGIGVEGGAEGLEAYMSNTAVQIFV